VTPGRSNEPRPGRLARLMPWTRLLKGPSLALDSRKLILAAIGLVLLWSGWAGLDRLFPNQAPLGARIAPSPLTGMVVDLSLIPTTAVTEPFFVLIGPFIGVFRTGQGLAAFTHAVLAAVWAVLVWGIVGGAIARSAAVQAATGERLGLVSAVRFALKHGMALVGAPLSPMIGIGFFAVLIAPLGLLYQIPGPIGATVAGVLAFLPLFVGLAMALLLAGLAVGWPLMTATVAVEAEDAFDALSRSYSYVSQRGGRYLVYAVVCWVAGAIGLIVVGSLAALAVHMARWGLSFEGPDDRIAALFAGDPDQGATPAAIHAFWIYGVRLLTHGWIYSYFFTASTLIYTLMRRDVDGAPYHDLGGLDEPDEPFGGPEDIAIAPEIASDKEKSES
jgi:hypothetical protein